MTTSKVMTLRMLPLNVPFDGANRWGIPAARIMAATMIGLKSGRLKACRAQAVDIGPCIADRQGRSQRRSQCASLPVLMPIEQA